MALKQPTSTQKTKAESLLPDTLQQKNSTLQNLAFKCAKNLITFYILSLYQVF